MNDLDRAVIKQRYLGLKKHYEKLNKIKSSESKKDFSVRSLAVKPKVLNCSERIIEVNRVVAVKSQLEPRCEFVVNLLVLEDFPT